MSTDIDIFVAPANLTGAVDVRGGTFYPRLMDALRLAGVEVDYDTRSMTRTGVFLSGQCADGTEWSLADMHYMNPAHPLIDSVEGTGVRAANLTEIFMGKIAGRALNADRRTASGKQPIPIRDCYDICVCAGLDPQTLHLIIDVLPETARERIAANFRSAPSDLYRIDKRPVITPAWSVELEGVATCIGNAIAAGDLAALPVAERSPATSAKPSSSAPCP